MIARRFEDTSEPTSADLARAWPVYWSAIWVGALAALAVALIAGLAAAAVGAHIVGPGEHMTSWRRVHFGGIIWTVCSAFFSFVIGGWIAARIAGHPRSESAMLHGAIAWLVALPFLVAAASFGLGGYFGAWYSGLGPQVVLLPDAELQLALVRNNALGAITALILGLIGSVIGGWMASGEPMSIFHYRTRTETTTGTPVVTDVASPLAR